MEATTPQIIPGLPDDIAMLCLLKVPRIYHACLASVCTAWRSAVSCPEFYQERRRLGSTDAWLVIVSMEILSSPALLYSAYDLSTRQLLFKVKFPPSLSVDAPAYGVDPTCGISFSGAPHSTAAYNCSPGVATHVYNSEFAHTTHVEETDVGRMPFNGTHDSRFAREPGFSVEAQGSMSAGSSKAGSTFLNAASRGKCIGSAAPKVVRCLENLDYYRIVAMNEYFAVLGFTQRSQLHPALCTFTIYNTVTDEWRHARPLSICREMLACGVIEGRLYVVGGFNEKGEMERTMEVYDFAVDEWGTAEALPEGIARMQGDVVYQGKLYVQCWEAGDEGKCDVWEYSPKQDKWEQLKGKHMGGQQLIATGKFMYAMGGQAQLARYEASYGEWRTLKGAKVRPGQVCSVNTHPSQTAFGHGDEIFVLQEANGDAACGLPSDAFIKCHRLLSVKPSWYHAGAVVQA